MMRSLIQFGGHPYWECWFCGLFRPTARLFPTWIPAASGSSSIPIPLPAVRPSKTPLLRTAATGLRSRTTQTSSASSPEMSAAELANREKIEEMIREVSARYRVDPALVRAVIQTESNWNSSAVSRKGALGLMQLVPGTAQQLGVNNAFDPKQNLDGGVRYLHMLLERYNGDLDKALAAYNAGPGAVDRAGGIPRYRETRNYVQKVTDSYFRPGSDRLPRAFEAAASHLPRGGCRRTGRFYERMRQTLRHEAATIRPILRVIFASVLVLSLFSLASRADDNSPSRRDAAKAQFERAEKARAGARSAPGNCAHAEGLHGPRRSNTSACT